VPPLRHRLVAACLAGLALGIFVPGPLALAQAPPPLPAQPPITPEPPRTETLAPEAFDEAVRLIPDAESRTELVIDGRRVIRVTTRAGLVYELIEDDGVVVSTLLEPENRRFRAPMWKILQW
jgi:hypothetical protein